MIRLIELHPYVNVREEAGDQIVEFKSSKRVLVTISGTDDIDGFYRTITVTIITYIYTYINFRINIIIFLIFKCRRIFLEKCAFPALKSEKMHFLKTKFAMLPNHLYS